MSAPRKYFGGRTIANRNSFDRINPKYVPPSRHAIFIRGFPSDVDNHKIRDFFQEAAKSTCGIDFTSYNEEQRKLSIALRFESHDIAQEMLTRFNNNEIFGYRVEITWFKDLKKARDRMIDDRRVPYEDHRMNYKPNRLDYDRKDNRDWSDSRNSRFPPNSNNNNHSKSLEKGEANSEQSYGNNNNNNNKQMSDYERSRSKSSIRSDKSESVISEDHERRSHSLSLRENRDKLVSLEKPSAYRVDLDDLQNNNNNNNGGGVHKVTTYKVERLSGQYNNDSFNTMEDGMYKQDLDEKKKKKKKRKRRRLDHSGSQESYIEPTKMPRYNESIDKGESNQFSAIAGDLSNWKQTASDSDGDFLTKKNNQINKSKARQTLTTNQDKLNNNEKNLKLLKLKVENIEKAYKKDSETYSSVISILIRKAPELKSRLESLMKEILVDAGTQCVDSMRDYILHLSDNNISNNPEPSMSPVSSG